MHTSTPYTNRVSQHSTIPDDMNISANIQFDLHSNGTQTNLKKRNKPLVEKRRRQRINHALDELRRLIVEPRVKHSNKLEKADILDLTVKFIKDLTANLHSEKYQNTFNESQQLEKARMFYYGYLSCETTFKSIIQKHFETQQKSSTSSTSLSTTSITNNNQNEQNNHLHNIITNELIHSKQFTLSQILNTEFNLNPLNTLSFLAKQTSISGNSDSSESINSMPDYSPTQNNTSYQNDEQSSLINSLIQLKKNNCQPVSSASSSHYSLVLSSASSASTSENNSLSNETNSLWRPW
ncbi:unnamed protein product [Schistosoma turkestanicum]|nr:unnamed protein product [Schistosoma turkestanicum]